jgi:hypothetical protein
MAKLYKIKICIRKHVKQILIKFKLNMYLNKVTLLLKRGNEYDKKNSQTYMYAFGSEKQCTKYKIYRDHYLVMQQTF